VGIELQLGVVGGDKSQTAALADVLEQRPRQSRALSGVGPCAELIQQDQRALVHLFQEGDDVRQMRREGGQALLDGLFITDINKHGFEKGERGPRICRDVHSRLRHQQEQSSGLERDRFAAGVGTRENQDVRFGIEHDIHGDHFLRVEQGMARPFQAQDGAHTVVFTGDRGQGLGQGQ